MPSAAKSAVAPLYLLACLVLGGSTQGIWQNMVLQLLGLAIIAWAAAAPAERPLPAMAKLLLILAVASIALILLQQLPLPPSLWMRGPRTKIVEDFRMLGLQLQGLPISLTPYGSLRALLCFIPPLAMFCAIVRLKAFRPSWLAAALLAGAVAGIALGALQVTGAGAGPTPYFYSEANLGSGVGFFANANHMASLLLIALPFVAALGAAEKNRNIRGYSALLTGLVALVLVLIVGIVLDGSLAGYLLAVPVLAASALIMLPPTSPVRRWIAVLGAISIIVAIAALTTSSIGRGNIGQDANVSVQARAVVLRTTGKAIADQIPFGTGLGSFEKVYRLYEDPDAVTDKYVVHAHNDYLELALELGVPGIILILLFLIWWATAVAAAWRKGEGVPFTRAASIASAAVLVHSLADFPLRTAAISACFAMCLALLADRRAPPRRDAFYLRPARHIAFT